MSSVHNKLTDDAGKILDISEDSKPLSYLHGAGNIFTGLENALVGKGEGDTLAVRVEPAEAYEEVNPDGIKVIERTAFRGVESVEAGIMIWTPPFRTASDVPSWLITDPAFN